MYQTKFSAAISGLRGKQHAPHLTRRQFRGRIAPVAGDQLIIGLSAHTCYEVDSSVYDLQPGDVLLVRGDTPRGPRAVQSPSAEYLICFVRDILAWMGAFDDIRQGRITPLCAPRNLTPMQRLAWRIRHTRELSHIAQPHVSMMAGLSKDHLGHIETGRCVPSLDSLSAIAGALNKPVAFFLDSDSEHMLHICITAGDWQARIPPSATASLPRSVDLLPADFSAPMFIPRIMKFRRDGFKPYYTRGNGQSMWLVLHGRISAEYNGETIPLDKDDIFYADAAHPHGITCMHTPHAVLLECASNIIQRITPDRASTIAEHPHTPPRCGQPRNH